MDEAELIGGVLDGAADPYTAAVELRALLLLPRQDRTIARRAGFEPELGGASLDLANRSRNISSGPDQMS